MNIYLQEVNSNLPRLLSLFNRNPMDSKYGVLDRDFWAWRNKDYINATNQGIVDGLTLLKVRKLWPYQTDEQNFKTRIMSSFHATKLMTASDGSLNEAMPNEKSWCVTSLIAWNLLRTLKNYELYLSRDENNFCLETIYPLINFVTRKEETHGKIGNHIAVATAALNRWNSFEENYYVQKRQNEYVSLIAENLSDEGWIREYNGADPGYQTLTMDYLADIYMINPSEQLKKIIEKSLQFLQYFIFPDGSFSGAIGSRKTRVYYPGGISQLATEFAKAKLINDRMALNLKNEKSVKLSAIDNGNLGPLFNSYAIAASEEHEYERKALTSVQLDFLPFESLDDFEINFKEAGIHIRKRHQKYSVLNWKNGGDFYHFKDNKLEIFEPAPVIKYKEKFYISNSISPRGKFYEEENRIVIESLYMRYRREYPTVMKQIVLRLLFLLSASIPRLNRQFKLLIVNRLYNRRSHSNISNLRQIIFDNVPFVTDKPSRGIIINYDQSKKFLSISQMASSGYWQIGDES